MKRRPSGSARRAPEALAWSGAAQAVLEPLVRALLDHGLRYADLIEILDRSVFRAGGATPARTGLPKAKARRLAARENGTPELPFAYAMGTRLVSRWLSEPAYRTASGPKTLPLEGPESFATLAQMSDIDSRVALRELKRLGMITIKGGEVTLLADAYVPSRGTLEKLDILGRDGAEFLRTMIANVTAPAGQALLQRKASYDNIGASSLKQLRAVLRQHGWDALMAANNDLAAADRDRNTSAPGGKRMRVSFGVYYSEEPVSSSRSAEPKKAKRRWRP